MSTTAKTANLEAKLETANKKLTDAKAAIAKVVIGQDDVVDLALGAVLSGGHALLVGVPGLAKTLLVETLATVLGMDGKRIQFTPDARKCSKKEQKANGLFGSFRDRFSASS